MIVPNKLRRFLVSSRASVDSSRRIFEETIVSKVIIDILINL